MNILGTYDPLKVTLSEMSTYHFYLGVHEEAG